MQSDHDMPGGAQTDQMLQVIFNKMNEQKSDMERTMAMQLDQFKQELHGATSSVSSEEKKLKTDQGTTWRNSGNRDQYEHNEKVSDILTQALWALSNENMTIAKNF